MRKLLYKLGLVKLVLFNYHHDSDSPYLRIVWYGKDGRYVKHRIKRGKLINPKVWYQLLPEGKVRYANSIHTADYSWEVYKPAPTLRALPFSFLGRAKAIEMKSRLDGGKG